MSIFGMLGVASIMPYDPITVIGMSYRDGDNNGIVFDSPLALLHGKNFD